MGFKVGDDSGGGMSEINVTPLIDIMLVMLIIFMLITPPALSQMAANLPSNDPPDPVPPEDVPKDQLVASVCEDGTFALNRKVMPIEELSEQVGRRLKSKAKKVVFIDAHPEAPYDKVVYLMDNVRGAGATRVGLGKLKEAEDFNACTPLPVYDVPAEGADGAATAAPATPG
jgi:biopolymer transport protein TolR